MIIVERLAIAMQALRDIANAEHSDDCDSPYVPLSECPCFDDRRPDELARKALRQIEATDE